MKINPLAHRALYLAVASALSPALAYAAGPVLADGIHVDVLDSAIETTAANTSGIQALNGGTVNAEGTDSVTGGTFSHGLHATGAGSHITFTGGTLRTANSSAYGAYASNGGQIVISGASISAGGVSNGINASGTGSAITVSDSDITMTAAYGSALFAYQGGAVTAQRATVRTIGEYGHGVLMGDSAIMDLTDSTIDTAANFSNGANVMGGQLYSTGTVISTAGIGSHGLYATGGMISTVATDISTRGLNAHGVLVDNASSVVSLDGGTITTAGQEAYGLYATAGAIQANNVDISTTGLGSIGVFARGADSEITLSNSRVTTSNRGHAAAAIGGAQLNILGSNLTTSGGLGINGVTARNAGTHVNLVDSSVLTNGTDSHGVLLSDQATASIEGSHIHSTSERGRSVWIMDGSSLSISDSLIQSSGDSSADASGGHFGAAALVVSSGAQAELINTRLISSGERAGALNVELADSYGRMIGGEIVTLGAGATAAAVFGGNNQMELDGVHVTTIGNSARGVVAGDAGSHANIISSIIETQGTASHGIQTVRGSSLDASNVHVLTHGDNAAGLAAIDGSIMTVAGSLIQTAGQGSNAARVLGGSALEIDGSVLHSVGAAALLLDNGTLTAANASHIESDTGRLAEFGSDAASHLIFSGNVNAIGDIRFADGATDSDGNGVLDRTSTLVLDDSSIWQGATDALGAVAISGNSRWDVTGDSQIGSLSLIDSSIVFDHAYGAYKTLTIDGDFHTDNGLLVMNAALGDDSSPSDRLHVRGDTSGNAHIAVNNIGGQGAQTEDGIRLVQVDGASDARYALAGRAVGGVYEYFLYQGGISDATDGDWYLRSVAPVDPIDPIDPIDPVDPVDPINPVDPIVVDPIDPIIPGPAVLRPEAGAYLANQAAAIGMFDLSMHERIGEPNLIERQKSGDQMGGAWVRATTDHNRGRINEQLSNQGRQHVLQMGTDLTRWGSNDRGVIGLMIGTGETTERVVSEVTGYAAEGRVKGRAAGVYGSWLQNAANDGGLYVDGWVQTARFRNSVQGDALARERYDSRSTSASVESGYAFKLRTGDNSALYLEPQAQVTWSDYRIDGSRHVEANGTEVRVADAGGVRTRVGLRMFGHTTQDTINRVQPFATVNWIRQHGDANGVWMDNVALSGAVPRDLYEAKVGAQAQLGRHLTAWGELSVGRGADDYRNYGGLLGVKYAW